MRKTAKSNQPRFSKTNDTKHKYTGRYNSIVGIHIMMLLGKLNSQGFYLMADRNIE